ncbi:unnamed protein product [Ixodes pacificus]
MADFDNFEANFDGPPAAEEDPAAEFLAREQDVLAGLEDDNDTFGVNVAEPLADGPTNDIAAEFGEIQVTTAFVSVWCILGCEVVDCCSGAKNKFLG